MCASLGAITVSTASLGRITPELSGGTAQPVDEDGTRLAMCSAFYEASVPSAPIPS